MEHKAVVENASGILLVILIILIASILLTIPFLILNYFFGFEAALFAFYMAIFIPPIYLFIKRRILRFS